MRSSRSVVKAVTNNAESIFTKDCFRHIRKIALLCQETFDAIPDSKDWLNKFCGRNNIEQIRTTAKIVLSFGQFENRIKII